MDRRRTIKETARPRNRILPGNLILAQPGAGPPPGQNPLNQPHPTHPLIHLHPPITSLRPIPIDPNPRATPIRILPPPIHPKESSIILVAS